MRRKKKKKKTETYSRSNNIRFFLLTSSFGTRKTRLTRIMHLESGSWSSRVSKDEKGAWHDKSTSPMRATSTFVSCSYIFAVLSRRETSHDCIFFFGGRWHLLWFWNELSSHALEHKSFEIDGTNGLWFIDTRSEFRFLPPLDGFKCSPLLPLN